MTAELAAYAAALVRKCVVSSAEMALQTTASSDAKQRLQDVTRSALALYDASRTVRNQHVCEHAVHPLRAAG
jgi:hypothetical protein